MTRPLSSSSASPFDVADRGAAGAVSRSASARGSIHVIVGPNGAGKTTLLAPLLAQVVFEGQIVAHWRRSGAIGYVPQSFAVDPSLPVTVAGLSGAHTAATAGLLRRRCFDAPQASTALLREVGLQDLEQRPLAVLSGGELRRVLLAHALDPVPELLILDEPASGLDEGGVRQLEELLRDAASGRYDGADGVARSRSGATHRRSRHGARSIDCHRRHTRGRVVARPRDGASAL